MVLFYMHLITDLNSNRKVLKSVIWTSIFCLIQIFINKSITQYALQIPTTNQIHKKGIHTTYENFTVTMQYTLLVLFITFFNSLLSTVLNEIILYTFCWLKIQFFPSYDKTVPPQANSRRNSQKQNCKNWKQCTF